MWNRSSSSISVSTDDRLKSARKRRRIDFSMLWPSRRPENVFHGDDVAPPGIRFDAERTTPPGAKPIVLGAPVMFARAPFAFDPLLELEPLQRRVERPLVHVEDVLGHLLDPL